MHYDFNRQISGHIISHMNKPKKIIITVKYSVLDHFGPPHKPMTDREVIEFFGDTPEILQECDFETDKKGNIVWKVERE